MNYTGTAAMHWNSQSCFCEMQGMVSHVSVRRGEQSVLFLWGVENSDVSVRCGEQSVMFLWDVAEGAKNTKALLESSESSFWQMK